MNWIYDNDFTFFWHGVTVKFVSGSFISLVMFSYRSKFHVNIITGSGVLTIYFSKRLNTNPERGNTLAWVLPKIWSSQRQVRDSKFGTVVSNEIFLNAAKYQSYSFHCSWVITLPPSTQIGTNETPQLVNKKCYTQVRPVIFFLVLGFPSWPFTNHRTAGEWEGISLSPHYKFHCLHRHLDISRAITAESSPPYIACSMLLMHVISFFRSLLLL